MAMRCRVLNMGDLLGRVVDASIVAGGNCGATAVGARGRAAPAADTMATS